MGEKSCAESHVGCVYDYGELDDEPCLSCHHGSQFKPRPTEGEKFDDELRRAEAMEKGDDR